MNWCDVRTHQQWPCLVYIPPAVLYYTETRRPLPVAKANPLYCPRINVHCSICPRRTLVVSGRQICCELTDSMQHDLWACRGGQFWLCRSPIAVPPSQCRRSSVDPCVDWTDLTTRPPSRPPCPIGLMLLSAEQLSVFGRR